jgi:hypothetical protein
MAGKTAAVQRLMSESLMDLFLWQTNTRTRFCDPLGADVRWARQHGLGLAGHTPEQRIIGAH